MEYMKAAVLTKPEQVEIKEIPVPPMKPGDIKIKVNACGVCGSDIHMWKAGHGWDPQTDNFVMGHEFCGTVIDPGDSEFKKGDRVVFWANLYCGKCDMCKSGKEHLCRDVHGQNYIGFVCNGAYAEQFVGKAFNAYKLPDTVSDVSAALIDPLMVAYHAVRKSKMKIGDKVLVVGSGIIAQLMGDLIKKAGASFLAMSKINDRKIKKAREIGDFDEYFDGRSPTEIEDMVKATNGGFDVVFEAVGNEHSLETCIDAVKPGGKIIAIGNSIPERIPFSLNKLVLHEIELIGSVSCTEKEFRETIDLLASGTVDAEKFVTEVLPLDKLQTAFQRQTSKDDPMLKLVIKP